MLPTKKKRTFSTNVTNAAANNSSDASSYYAPPQLPQTSVATTQALQAGANPDILNKAAKYLGSKDFTGLCEKFAETVTQGKTGLYSSAIEAFDRQKDKVRTDIENMPVGSQIFFSANQGNGDYGHTGVASSPSTFVSATNNGVKNLDIAKWEKATGQTVLGYIPPTAPTT